jgi:hypothetical protein
LGPEWAGRAIEKKLTAIYQVEECYIFIPEDEGSRCNRIVNNDFPDITTSLSSILNTEAADFSETLLTIELATRYHILQI